MSAIGSRTAFPILMADDDPDDRLLAQEALEECRIRNPIFFVENGEQLMDYLKHRGIYSVPSVAPRPGLILLDLNMPRKNGREALKEIKADPELRSIPVIILTTSNAEEDITYTYGIGANSYVQKPVTFDGLVRVMESLKQFWLEIVVTPYDEEANSP